MFKKCKKFALTIPFFFSKKTDDKLYKSLIIIEGPGATGIVELLKKRDNLPITYYVTLQSFSLFNKIRSKNQLYYYPGLLAIIRCGISGFIKYFKSDSKKKLILSVELELALNCFKNLKNSYKSIVIFNERMEVSALASEWARANKIKSCCVQHGAIVENYFPVMVDTYFVWDKNFGEIINSSRVDLKIIETGRLSETPVYRNVTRSNIPLVVLQPSGVSIPEKIIISCFVEIIEECLNFYGEVVLRPHPNDNNLKKILEYFPGNERIKIDSKNLIDSLSSSHVVISLYSTVLIEAIYCGCLAIQYINKSWYSDIFYRTQFQVEGKAALRAFIANIKTRTKADHALTNHSSSMLEPRIENFLNTIFSD
tara:strand:- start:162 stop:1265 length:1104 start_codon:yes stop_codon:yes gene_type:complete